MTDVPLKLEVKGLDKVQGLLDRLKEAGKDTHKALGLVGQRMLAMQKRHFRKQEGPDGTPWEPLRPKTIARRRAGRGSRSYATGSGRIGMGAARAITHFGGAVPVAGTRGVKILQDTGTMYRSLVYSAGRDDVEVGIPKFVPYAATHQFGDKSRNIPARPFIYLNKREAQQLVNMFKREVLKDLE